MENINSNLVGLTDSEVQQRVNEGKVNISTNIKTKSIKRIFCDNLFTLFNLINVILLAALIFVGSHKNMLFIGVVIANIIIGIVQEIRSKISVDKLTILSEKKINVLRNGKISEISKDEIVLDDILVLSRGSQIPADCIVCDGNCRVNESLLTGESNLIEKNVGDELLSGSKFSDYGVIQFHYQNLYICTFPNRHCIFYSTIHPARCNIAVCCNQHCCVACRYDSKGNDSSYKLCSCSINYQAFIQKGSCTRNVLH